MVDRPSWSGDGRRLVYAAEGNDGQVGLWVVSAEGGAPVAVPSVSGRSPAWSPVADAIAYFTSVGGRAPDAVSRQPRRSRPGPTSTSTPRRSTPGLLLGRGAAGDRHLAGIRRRRDRRRGPRDRSGAQRAPRRRSRGCAGSPGPPTTRASSTASSSTRAACCSSTASAGLEHRHLHAALAGDVDRPLVARVDVAHDAGAGVGGQDALEAGRGLACRRPRTTMPAWME